LDSSKPETKHTKNDKSLETHIKIHIQMDESKFESQIVI